MKTKLSAMNLQQGLRNKYQPSWHWAILGILLISLLPAGEGSLVVKMQKRETYRVFQNGDTDTLPIATDLVSGPSHLISKRDTQESNATVSTKVKGHAVPLNDSHNQLLVFWAGEDVILCLAKDINKPNASSSTLWISRDYGGSFTNATSLLVAQPTIGGSGEGSVPPPVLEGFFNHPSHNGHFAFSDVVNKVLYTTKNYGAEFAAEKVDFVPDKVLFDPHSDNNIVAYEQTTKEKRMYVSIDFGKSWTKVQEYVKGVSWEESKFPAVLFVQREEPSTTPGIENTVVLKSTSMFLEDKDTEVIISGVEEFELKDDFMFATKQKENGSYDLFIAYKNLPFKKALFPSHHATRHFFIADVSDDGQIFVCVVQNESVSNLYIGSYPLEDEQPKFSLSLERILYFKPNVTWSQSWLNEVADEPFVDLHHVDGLRGVYIASQLKPSTVASGKFSMNEVISLITYDQGGEWNVLNPPDFEHDGRPIYCQYTRGNCSLHISQRLSELYPGTRAVPILSKKSAVGIVLATGTVNTTLKGHLGVYLSTDGANSWRQILHGNYLYAVGDHGSIIVATKMYRIGDETNELIYTLDEGETWEKYEFYSEKVRIMGLMTEPGENTTTFFIFGSVVPRASNTSSSSKHTWVLIKVDFRDAFNRDCKPSDYKQWSPWIGEDGSMRRQCLLGRQDFYERRLPFRRCYNGKNFVRHTQNKTCLCKRIDFECDFGYAIDPHDKSPEKECVKDNSETSPGVKPEWCKPTRTGFAEFYNKTRGYRKVPGDTCTEGDWVEKYLPERISCKIVAEPEFILVAKRDSILRIDMNRFERVETLPLAKVKAVIAVEYVIRNNCLIWSDVHHKTIMKLHLDGISSPEAVVNSDINSVEGLSYDWMANNLYFTDGSGAKIEVVRLDKKRMRKRLLTKPVVEKPRGIAVHPEKGFIFWTDWSSTNPGVGRAHLDGSNHEMIVKNTNKPHADLIKWPNGITVDFERDRLFWVDAGLDKIFTSDLSGGDLQVVLEKSAKVGHPFAVGIYKDNVYWDDWTTRGIYGAAMEFLSQKEANYSVTAESTFKIKGELPRLMDLKVYGPSHQLNENDCKYDTTSCNYLCFSNPSNTSNPYTCVCPDGFVMNNGTCVCPDGNKPIKHNGIDTCKSNCVEGPSTFKCRSHPEYCIVASWRCDGENDCQDGSDEEDCGSQECEPFQFKCKKNGQCIPQSFVCDYDHDCGTGDESDEFNCTSKNPCDPTKNFLCANGRCILNSWRCDMDDDCQDGSDEVNCTAEATGKNGTFTCLPTEWKCPNENKCLSPDWLCDFDHDCTDGSDELNCTGRVCPDTKFSCKPSGGCIMKTWECDGDKDCPDGSDEHADCPPATAIPLPIPDNPFGHGNCSQMTQMFECLGSKECIPVYWKCDRVKDCQDGSDELGCPGDSADQPHTVTVAPLPERCEMDQWRCNDGRCIGSYAVCDGFPDCSSREDEANCHNETSGGCAGATRRCGISKSCVLTSKWCDGQVDCPNRADEADCKTEPLKCNSGEFICDESCQPLFKRCNDKHECMDGADEIETICTPSYKRILQVEGINFDEVHANSAHMEWWLPPLTGKGLEFIPSRCEIESKLCLNASSVTGRDYLWTELQPFKRYSTTVYVKETSSGIVHPPFKYQNMTTQEAQAGAPFGLQVTQNSTEDLIISWKRPHTPNGKIKGYKVYFSPPATTQIDAIEEKLVISNKQSDPVFIPGDNYTFWVAAVNGYGEGNLSQPITYVYNGDVAFLTELKVKGVVTENKATLIWEPSNSNVDNYAVLLMTNIPNSMYVFRNNTETKNKLIVFENLSAGTPYKVTIIPKYKSTHGNPRTIGFTTKGTSLPKIEGLTAMTAQNGNVKLSWRAAKVAGDSSLQYGVYYGKTQLEMAQHRARLITTQTQIEVPGLEACENYIFDVGLIKIPSWEIGPLTEKPQQVVTRMNPKSPPKSVNVFPAPDGGIEGHAKILVKWESPCGAMDKPTGYNITLVETTNSYSYGVSNISFSEKPELSFELAIQYGGRYQLTVSTSVPGGKPSVPVYFDGPAIPFPDQVRECSQCQPLTIYWTVPNLPLLVTRKGPHKYVVYVSRNSNLTDPKVFETRDSSFKFDAIKDNGIYYVSVSVKDAEGLESPRSEPIVIQHQDASAIVSLPSSSAFLITVTVITVILLLAAVLAIYVIRHKRLQTSFLNFASSHYSSSAGAATFQQTVEDQDSPVIRGFSDDEPLLVA